MFQQGQRPDPTRYTIIPRTLIFLTRPGEVLLLRVGRQKGAWAGHLNGLGGHVEAGEDPLQAACREVMEETSLAPARVRLVGAILIDVGKDPGIGLYVFVGVADGAPAASSEGKALWVPLHELDRHPLVEDIPEVLPLALRCYQEAKTFTGIYRFATDGEAVRTFTVGSD